jgi:integrase
MEQQKIIELIKIELNRMPDYIKEYYHSKLSVPYSYNTLYEYLKIYHLFFQWLIDSDITQVAYTTDIELSTLENLSKQNMEAYVVYLRERPNMLFKAENRSLNNSTISRIMSALSSLFLYLTEETENTHGEPYFYRNVMKKVKLKLQTQTLQARAENIKEKLFLGEETQEFLDYIDTEYEKKLTPRALSSFRVNKERDLALIALMLASGIRLSECTNINIEQLNLNVMLVEVVRKGGAKDSVRIAPFAKPYLIQYLEIRQERYNAEDSNRALFLTKYKGKANRITGIAVEKLVPRYSQDFKVRVTPHKLRHTLATRLYNETKSQTLTAQQLGHKNTSTTDLYVHVSGDAVRSGLDAL